MGYPDVAWGINELRESFYGGVQEFKDDGTFVVPDNVTKIYITACGGGGGGSGAYWGNSRDKFFYCGNGGGGGAAVVKKAFSVVPNSSIQITVGKGGAAGSNKKNGSNGTDTIIGNLLTLKGGSGGIIESTQRVPAISGGDGGGYGGVGVYNFIDISDTYLNTPMNAANGITGTAGFVIFSVSINSDYTDGIEEKISGGGGGGGSIGNGGNGASKDIPASTAGYGGGGGGGYYKDDSSQRASAGGNGIVIIEW